MDVTPPDFPRTPVGPDRLASGEMKKTIESFFQFFPEKVKGAGYSDRTGSLLVARTLDHTGIVSRGEVTLNVFNQGDAEPLMFRSSASLLGDIWLNSPLVVEDRGIAEIQKALTQRSGITATWHRRPSDGARVFTFSKDNTIPHISISIPQPQEASDHLKTTIYPRPGDMTRLPLIENQARLVSDLTNSVPVSLELMKHFMGELNRQVGETRIFSWYAPEFAVSQDQDIVYFYDKRFSGGLLGRIIPVGE